MFQFMFAKYSASLLLELVVRLKETVLGKGATSNVRKDFAHRIRKTYRAIRRRGLKWVTQSIFIRVCRLIWRRDEVALYVSRINPKETSNHEARFPIDCD